MSTTIVVREEGVMALETEATDVLTVPNTNFDAPSTVGIPTDSDTLEYAPALETPPRDEVDRPKSPTVFVAFCYEDPDSFIGQYVGRTVAALAENGTLVHLFARHPFAAEEPGVRTHAVGECECEDMLGSVQEFTRRACNAFLRQFPAGSKDLTLLGYEWSSVPALSLLHALRNCAAVVSFHSLEWQRSDMSNETSWRIAEIELAGLREARTILVHQAATAKIARRRFPECAGRIVEAHQFFPCGSSRD
jgi:hypothetical protein